VLRQSIANLRKTISPREREREEKGTVDVTAPRQIEQVILDTGCARRSPRSAIEDEIMRVLDASVDRAITTGTREPIPGGVRFSFNVTTEAVAAIVKLCEATPVVTFGIAADAASSPKLWRLLHEGGVGKHATSPDRPPATPWIGARMEIGAALTAPGDLSWIADFERCLAWALIDRRGRAPSTLP
jgi:hypothetical protein